MTVLRRQQQLLSEVRQKDLTSVTNRFLCLQIPDLTGCWQMAQWVLRLRCKPEDLSSNLNKTKHRRSGGACL